jgi:hypothetical protein
MSATDDPYQKGENNTREKERKRERKRERGRSSKK